MQLNGNYEVINYLSLPVRNLFTLSMFVKQLVCPSVGRRLRYLIHSYSNFFQNSSTSEFPKLLISMLHAKPTCCCKQTTGLRLKVTDPLTPSHSTGWWLGQWISNWRLKKKKMNISEKHERHQCWTLINFHQNAPRPHPHQMQKASFVCMEVPPTIVITCRTLCVTSATLSFWALSTLPVSSVTRGDASGGPQSPHVSQVWHNCGRFRL